MNEFLDEFRGKYFFFNKNGTVIELTLIPLSMHVLTISRLLPRHALWSELQLNINTKNTMIDEMSFASVSLISAPFSSKKLKILAAPFEHEISSGVQ